MNIQNKHFSAVKKSPQEQKHCSLCGRRKIVGLGWYRIENLRFCRRCWPSLDPTIEWFESRYTLLENCLGNAFDQRSTLFTLLDKYQSHVGIKDGEWLTDQIIQRLVLPCGSISFEFVPMKSKIAGTVECIGNKYQVKMSKDLEDNFRSVSAILIHELMHIYLQLHGISCKTQQEYEEATDLACVLLGFGIPMINAQRAWKVDRASLGNGGIKGGTEYYMIGYLSERQIGYAFATFLANHNITLDEMDGKIDQQCLFIIEDGIRLENAYRCRLVNKRNALLIIKQHQFQKEVCEFLCPVCFQKMAVPQKTIRRVGTLKAKCPKCHSFFQFDGERVATCNEPVN